MTNLELNTQIDSVSLDTTTNRYNRGQLYKSPEIPKKSFLFAIDWFEVTCVHGLGQGLLKDFDMDNPGDEYSGIHTTLRKDIKTGNGTKMYKFGYEVLFNNQSVGLLLLCPRLSYRDEYHCSLKLHNHILYQRGWNLIYERLLSDIGMKKNNYTRIDIACDGSGFIDKYKLLNQGIYQNVGRAKHTNHQTAKNVMEGFTVGSRSSDKFVRGYSKGQRLVVEQKKYISDYWEKNNLVTPIDKVERLELTLKNKALAAIVNFDYTRLEDQSYLASLMKCQLDGYLQLVKNSILKKDSNITRAIKTDMIPWKKLELTKVVKMKKVKKPSSVWGMKRFLTTSLHLIEAGYVAEKDLFDLVELKNLRALAAEYNIEQWFEDLVTRINKRDKSLIAEMKYNRLSVLDGEGSLYKDQFHDVYH